MCIFLAGVTVEGNVQLVVVRVTDKGVHRHRPTHAHAQDTLDQTVHNRHLMPNLSIPIWTILLLNMPQA